MAETFASLTARIRAQDMTITPEELEKLIAYRVSELVDEVFKQIRESSDIASLRYAIQDRFDFCCEIAPAMSIYVNVSNEAGKNDVPPFSSLPFEEAIRAIMQKDFSTTSPEEILGWTRNVMNNACNHFLEAVILSNPELIKLFGRFMRQFGKSIMAITDPPVMLQAGEPQPAPAPALPSDQRPGMYL